MGWFPERVPGYIPSGLCVRRPLAGRQPKADMDNLDRVRRASIQVAKVQRRIWLLQAFFWLAVVVAGGVITAVALRRWRRRDAALRTDDVRPAVANGAGAANPAEARLNGASRGNPSA